MNTRAFATEIVRLQLQEEVEAAAKAEKEALKKYGAMDTRYYRAAKRGFDALKRLEVLGNL